MHACTYSSLSMCFKTKCRLLPVTFIHLWLFFHTNWNWHPLCVFLTHAYKAWFLYACVSCVCPASAEDSAVLHPSLCLWFSASDRPVERYTTQMHAINRKNRFKCCQTTSSSPPPLTHSLSLPLHSSHSTVNRPLCALEDLTWVLSVANNLSPSASLWNSAEEKPVSY